MRWPAFFCFPLLVSLFTYTAPAEAAVAVEASRFPAREQDRPIPPADEFTTVQLLPEISSETRGREQASTTEAKVEAAQTYFVSDWSKSEIGDGALRAHPLIYVPPDLNDPGRAERNRSSEAFAKDEAYRTLKECIQRAVSAHVPLEIAADRGEASRRKVIEALRKLYPDLEAEFKNGEGSNTSGFFQGDSWRINMKQPIFRGGSLWNKLREEKENYRAAVRAYDEKLNNLIRDVSEAYFELARAEAAEAERTAMLEETDWWRGITEEKFNAQLISEVERLNVASMYHEQMARLEVSAQEVAVARLTLQKWLGLEVIDEVAVKNPYELDVLMRNQIFLETLGRAKPGGTDREESGLLDDYIQLAYQNRPELEMNTHKARANSFAELVARGMFLPKVDFIFEFGQLFEIASQIDNDPQFGSFQDEKEYRIGLEMDWNVAGNTLSYDQTSTKNAPNLTSFNGGGEGSSRREASFSLAILDNLESFTEVKEAEIERREALVDLEEAERQVVEDVKKAYYDYEKARIELLSLVRRLDYRDRLVQLSKIRLDKNEIQASEYLQSRLDLANDRIEMHQSLADFFRAKARLNHAVGLRELMHVEDLYV